ncbi:hypothetical protein [uncultured Draconibacterium sp.]|uniref:hypothetical protein n=1 Tax=uncultured Draconibacterium sp. TaxID=1573823 RepID=UPI003217ACA7
MMVLKIHFSPDEISAFFRSNGFAVENRKFGKWVPVYHNKSDWVETHEPAVVVRGEHVKASVLFEKVVEYRLKRIIAPTSVEIKGSIEKSFKTCLNGK